MYVHKIPPLASDKRYEDIGIQTIAINVDSRLRKYSHEPGYHFRYYPHMPLRNVVSARITSVEKPNSFPWISEARHTNTMTITILGNTINVEVPSGNYSATQLITEIESQLISSGFGTWSVTFNIIPGLITITETGNIPFEINFDKDNFFEKRDFDFGLGYILGFRNKTYSGSSSYTGESHLNLYGEQYLFINVNDYNTIFSRSRENEITGALAKVILNAAKTNHIFDNFNNITKRYVFETPVNIDVLETTLLDAYGNVVPIDLEWSYTIEFDVIRNSRLYERYRTHLLMG